MRNCEFYRKACLDRLALLTLLICFFAGNLPAAEPPGPLVVHEWGTFTALLNESGDQLMGINVDTEPVPSFVHNLSPYLLNSPVLSSEHWVHRQKAVPRHHPLVSLRLETPVIYFYPPKGAKLPLQVDVEVKFSGGWLTEFYPKADVLFPVMYKEEFDFNDLSPLNQGKIAWRNLQIGTPEPGPETADHVWLAPRKVAAASVTSSSGEHEKYLFYRGVAQQTSPLRVHTLEEGNSLAMFGTYAPFLKPNQSASIQNLWLMETRADGTSAYRQIEKVPVVNNGLPAAKVSVSRRFTDAEFSTENRTKLEAEMKKALLGEGLFEDEATALLSTWQQAYFVSPGLRIFYTVPRAWTDLTLPLTISGETQITRVMIGRVELISDHQRRLLNELIKAPVSKGDWLAKVPWDSPALARLLAGRSDIGDLGAPIPPDFQMYLDLGRFRNALIADEAKESGSANLAAFVIENNLQPFRLAQKSGK